MSTTIYRGKRLPDMSVYQLNEFYKELRSELIPLAKREYYKLVVRVSQEIYVYMQTGEYPGHYHLNLNEIKDKSNEFKADINNLLTYALEFVNKTVQKTSTAIFRYDAENDADFDVSLVILPIKDKTLALPYANHDVLYDALTQRSEFEEYGYWNNTDRPKELHDYEWHQRKVDWDEALPNIGIPKNNGMVLHLVDAVGDIIEHHLIDIKREFMCFLIDDEELLTKVAHGVILTREFEKLIKEYTGGDESKNMQYGMKCLRLATEYIKKHPDEVEKEKSNYGYMFNSKEFFSTLVSNQSE